MISILVNALIVLSVFVVLYTRTKMIYYIPILLVFMFVAGYNSVFLIFLAIVFGIFLIKPIRRHLISRFILSFVRAKNLLPKVSETEKIALDAGNTWIEKDLFSGMPNFNKIWQDPYPTLIQGERDFIDTHVNHVCEMASDWEIFEQKDMPTEVWQYLKDNKFFGMIIPKEYGGLEFSPLAQSTVVAKLATRSQVLAITVMVPNSLGPAELLLKYGTAGQKNHYLPRLADGREVPCFALTEPNAGSDAASISSEGVAFVDADGVIKIRLNFEKRYITLGGIATVIGLAFQLKDPDNILPQGVKSGITCALLDGKLPGIVRGRRHNPLNVPFINSPIWGKDVIITLDDVIGGVSGCGNGWKMLMECLAVGRGLSLPAISTGGMKIASQISLIHTSIRRQFGLPLIKFEGIEETLAKMLAETYKVDAARRFVAGALANGYKPSVANAIIKYHATEGFRRVVNHGMDVMGGQGICLGENNLIAHGYFGAPIAITVEGANIMTRYLLQFGQGLIRCHPYIYNEMVAITEGDVKKFDDNFWPHIGHVLSNRVRMVLLSITKGWLHKPFVNGKKCIITYYERKLAWTSASFAFLADAAILMHGGNLKRKEKLSGRFADILSGMFMITSVLRRFRDEKQNDLYAPFVEYSCNSILKEMDLAFEGLYENLSPKNKFMHSIMHFFGFFASHNRLAHPSSDEVTARVVKNVLDNPEVFSGLLDDVFVSKSDGDHLSNLMCAFHSSKISLQILKLVKDYNVSLLDARETGIISDEEYEFVKHWNELVNSLIQVNHFEFKVNSRS